MGKNEILQMSEMSETSEPLVTVARDFFSREFSRIQESYASSNINDSVLRFRRNSRRVLSSDQSFLDPDLLTPIFKSALLIITQQGGSAALDAIDQFVDSINENEEGIKTSAELLTPEYIRALFNENVRDAKDFIESVGDGNIIF